MIDEIAHLGLVDEAEIELDKAALELAALDHPGVDLAPYLALLDDMAERLRIRAQRTGEAAQQAAALAEVLGGEFGFAGDDETYDDPANADLLRVLDRRRGLPVSLSILYVALARRLGWSADALNTPTHVLVSLGGRGRTIVDPFNSGIVVDPQQLTNFIRAALGGVRRIGPEHVAPMANRAILVRLLMNQVTRAEQNGEAERALVLLQRTTTVSPGYAYGWWERARLEREAGDKGSARDSLTALLETTRDKRFRSHVKTALDALNG